MTNTCTTQPSCAVPSTGLASNTFVNLIATLTNAYCNIIPLYPADFANLTDCESFDFIIVGAGSAGCIVANRLTENASHRVLLIEAGTDPPFESQVPGYWPFLSGSLYDWRYTTETSPYSCQAQNNATCIWNKGKALGGSSSINGMLYNRGSQEDYDSWANAGNEGWRYNQLLSYFKKLEHVNITGTNANVSNQLHGFQGPVGVHPTIRNDVDLNANISAMLIQAAKELGVDYIDDLCSLVMTGMTSEWSTTENGVRSSTATAYLTPIVQRANLNVLKGTLATRVILQERRAIGVEIIRNGRLMRVYSTKEVILSAGTIETPHIMMLSGLGPEAHLKQFGIPVVNDLQVGYNLQDHYFLGSSCLVLPLTYDSIDTASAGEQLYNYLTHRADLNGTAYHVIYVNATNISVSSPDVEYLFTPTNQLTIGSAFKWLNYQQYIIDQAIEIRKTNYLLNAYIAIVKPKSRGRVMLSDTDPTVKPIIETGYLTDPADMDVLIAGTRFLKQLASRLPNASIWFPTIDECARFDENSDEYYECLVRYTGTTYWHPVGTCKMGPQNDSNAVVDPRLKVYGVDGLRIIDASVMPIIPSGNTNVPTMMLAEKGVDMVNEDWRGTTAEN